MARRNMFQPPPPPEAPDAGARPRFPNTGAMSGVKSTLKDLSANAVRDIDTALIDEDGPKDRLAFSDADVALLAESIRQHGQQVPIMVRPLPDHPGRFRVVYGRRRLRALRLLGLPAKALVRSLDDAEAVLAQGQENAQRLDPSFVEKALFAAQLAEGGYGNAVIMDALAIDKAMLSRMSKVARGIPAEVIRLVGPAHGIGRRRWEELAELGQEPGVDLETLAAGIAGMERLGSDERFARISVAAQTALRDLRSRPAGTTVSVEAGTTRIAELRHSARSVTIRLGRQTRPGFAEWLGSSERILQLYEEWAARNGQDAD